MKRLMDSQVWSAFRSSRSLSSSSGVHLVFREFLGLRDSGFITGDFPILGA